MPTNKDYKNLSFDEKLTLLDGKLDYLDKLIIHIEEKLNKLEKLENKLSIANIQNSFSAEEITKKVINNNQTVVNNFPEQETVQAVETVAKAQPAVRTQAEDTIAKEHKSEPIVSEVAQQSKNETVAMGGSFGFGGNKPLDSQYTPVEKKETVIMDNIPLGGSFGFENEKNKASAEAVQTQKNVANNAQATEKIISNNQTVVNNFPEQATVQAVETVAKTQPIVRTQTEDTNSKEEHKSEPIVSEVAQQSKNETVAMGGSFGFGGNKPLDSQYTPVEKKETVIMDNIPLGGSFGFENEKNKASAEAVQTQTNVANKAQATEKVINNNQTVVNNFPEQETVQAVETVAKTQPIVRTQTEDTNSKEEHKSEPIVSEVAQQSKNETVAMGGSFGFGGNKSLDSQYTPVEKKETVIMDNIPLGGSFGFENEKNKASADAVQTQTNVSNKAQTTEKVINNNQTVVNNFPEQETVQAVETVAKTQPIVRTQTEDTNSKKEHKSEPIVSEVAQQPKNETVAMGGSFGFGGNKPLDSQYTTVEKEKPVIMDNIPLGGSFGFNNDNN